jgi:hypothetical protein
MNPPIRYEKRQADFFLERSAELANAGEDPAIFDALTMLCKMKAQLLAELEKEYDNFACELMKAQPLKAVKAMVRR